MSALPTRIRQNIRDQIDSPSSDLALKTKALTTTLGYPIVLDPEWSMLWESLKPSYPDPSTFIPTISNTLIAWCDCFTSWLENEDNEEAIEKFLDGLKGGNCRIYLEVSGSYTRSTTSWDAKRCAFIIDLSKAKQESASAVQAGFATDLMALFISSPILPPSTLNATVDDPDAWADLSLDSREIRALPAALGKANVEREEPESIPQISSVARPEELTNKPPYWMIIRQETKSIIVIQGSHGPSLGFLEGYLKKWCRGDVNRSSRSPVVEIKLQESVFGLGLIHDCLVLEAVRGREINATLMLVVVESVLGYSMAERGRASSGVWEFKRTRPFK